MGIDDNGMALFVYSVRTWTVRRLVKSGLNGAARAATVLASGMVQVQSVRRREWNRSEYEEVHLNGFWNQTIVVHIVISVHCLCQRIGTLMGVNQF
mmetsp:Transcript_6365/g.11354  ORF Transcript_6365/g.11354 Transcript_6365/m.11354 type:complete len:96 (-) Transcript_6365:1575-1862(-)